MPNQLKTYLKLCTEYYDLNKSITGTEFAFYFSYAKQASGPVLEPMCGTGRFLIPILQADIDIEGFDASTYMLDALKKKYALISSQPAPVWQQFVQDFSSDKKYALIFIPFGSWGLITNHDNAQKSLKILYDHLAPDGTLLLEIDTVHSLPEDLNVWQQDSSTRPDGSQLVLNRMQTYNPTTQLFLCVCRYESISKNNVIDLVETEDFYQYLYRPDELDEQLDTVGFKQIRKFQDFYKTPAQNDSQLIIYECVKRSLDPELISGSSPPT